MCDLLFNFFVLYFHHHWSYIFGYKIWVILIIAVITYTSCIITIMLSFQFTVFIKNIVNLYIVSFFSVNNTL